VLGDDVSAGDEAALNVADDAGDVAVSFWGRGVLRGWKLRSRELRLRSIGENFRVGRGWALREESLRGSRMLPQSVRALGFPMEAICMR